MKIAKRIFKYLFLSINSIFIIAIFCAYLAQFVSPQTLSILPFAGLIFWYLVLANLVFVLLWLLLKPRWFALFSLAAVAVGYPLCVANFQMSEDELPPSSQKFVRVMSYNVCAFSQASFSKKNDSLFNFLNASNPQIICFQEYMHLEKSKRDNRTAAYIAKQLKNLPHKAIFSYTSFMSLAIYSHYPIVQHDTIFTVEHSSAAAMFADINVKGDTLRVYNLHLQCTGTDTKERELVANLTSTEFTKPDFATFYSLYKHMRENYILRAEQAERVAEHIKSSPYPVILCGDFNDTPVSYVYHTIAKNMNDAFKSSSSGFGHTFQIGENYSARIDYILHSDNIQSYNFQTHTEAEYSDHSPISTIISY